MEYKYGDEISKIPFCPPDELVEEERLAYRFVHPNDMEKSFIPVALDGKRRFRSDEEKCLGYGISLFDTFENALRRKSQLKKRHKNIEKKIGTEIAEGEITPELGKCSKVNHIGHYTLFEREGIKLEELFCLYQEGSNHEET